MKALDDLDEQEKEELILSLTSDIKNFILLEEEHTEILSLVNEALNASNGKLLLEFLLGVPSLENYLKEEIEKLNEYIEERNNEESAEEND